MAELWLYKFFNKDQLCLSLFSFPPTPPPLSSHLHPFCLPQPMYILLSYFTGASESSGAGISYGRRSRSLLSSSSFNSSIISTSGTSASIVQSFLIVNVYLTFFFSSPNVECILFNMLLLEYVNYIFIDIQVIRKGRARGEERLIPFRSYHLVGLPVCLVICTIELCPHL